MRKNIGISALSLILLAMLSAVVGGCGRDADDGSPHTVLLVTVDALRTDQLSVYGGPTPLEALESMAASGLVYDDVTVPVPMSRPATASLMTGLGPLEHGVWNDVSDVLEPGQATLASRFQEAGWETAAFVNSPTLSWGSGLTAGFDLFDGPDNTAYGPAMYNPKIEPFGERVQHLGDWLDRVPSGKKAFAWVHVADLLGAATDAETGEALPRYTDRLGQLDGVIAEILAIARRLAESRSVELVIVGTYGTLLGEEEYYGGIGSAYWLQEESLKVPLVRCRFGDQGLHLTGRDSGRRELVDLHATLLRYLGSVQDADFEGIDLDAGEGRPNSQARYAWTWAPSDDFAWPALTAVDLGGGWKLFHSDVLAAGNVSGVKQDEAFRAAARVPAVPRPYQLSADVRQRLLQAGLELGERDHAAPRLEKESRARFLNQLVRIRHHFAENRNRRIGRSTNRQLENHPDNLAALLNRAVLMVMFGSEDRAGEVIDKLLKLYPNRPEVLHWSAHLALLREELDRAELLLEAARSLGYQDGDLLYDLACLAALKEHTERSLVLLEEAIHAGYRNWRWMEQDSDLESIRSNPGYARLMQRFGR